MSHKSKFPDLNELSAMAGKLFKDVKNSVQEIIHDYKQKHRDAPSKPASRKTASHTHEEPSNKKTRAKTTKDDPKYLS